jgi:dCMP deaminase
MNEKWDRYFLGLALAASRMSRDPSTRVGSVIVRNQTLLSTGFNGFPRGIADDERLFDRDTKIKLVVHGEMNAVLNAARNGTALEGATMYTACQSNGATWGGPPCTRCAVECIQAGIREVVSYPFKLTPSRWRDDLSYAEALLAEAGVVFRSLPLDP